MARKNQKLTVACVQLNSKQSVLENLSNTKKFINKACDKGADFILTPEISNIVSIENQPGNISISEDLLVATADFYIKINSIQMSGGQMLTGKEFIKNYQLKPSEKFSNV